MVAPDSPPPSQRLDLAPHSPHLPRRRGLRRLPPPLKPLFLRLLGFPSPDGVDHFRPHGLHRVQQRHRCPRSRSAAAAWTTMTSAAAALKRLRRGVWEFEHCLLASPTAAAEAPLRWRRRRSYPAEVAAVAADPLRRRRRRRRREPGPPLRRRRDLEVLPLRAARRRGLGGGRREEGRQGDGRTSSRELSGWRQKIGLVLAKRTAPSGSLGRPAGFRTCYWT